MEYLGTGGELFVGFLIAIVILVPFGAVYSLLQFLMVGMEGPLPIIIQVIYYTIIAFLIHIAIYRMRRYRPTRTIWRGVRFDLDGSAVRYAVISFAYTALSLVTLLLANPWLRVSTLKYFFANARFGGTSLSLSANASWLLPRWLNMVVVDAKLVNAFALPGGYVVVTSGLIKAAGSPEEIAGVVSHEIGHVFHQHPTQAIYRTTAVSLLISAMIGDFSDGILVTGIAEWALNSSYSHKAERAADTFAIKRLNAANIDGSGLLRFFDKISKKSEKKQNSKASWACFQVIHARQNVSPTSEILRAGPEKCFR